MPNYVTSYANEKSSLITIHLEEDRGARKISVFFATMILIFVGLPILFSVSRIYGASSQSGDSIRMQTTRDEPDAAGSPLFGHEVPGRGVKHAAPPADHEARKGRSENLSTASSIEREALATQGTLWGTPQPEERCLGFEKRLYTARLRASSLLSDGRRVCERMPITIRGVTINQPDSCQRRVGLCLTPVKDHH
ncbi:hypothetical protein CC2G_010677 [Coprinopsis cinerea AmutBmut pab1-1]|nr:hypothetical protein CC2G_010677 [Coprinopsis cinerea AmutBmut pab1-1]